MQAQYSQTILRRDLSLVLQEMPMDVQFSKFVALKVMPLLPVAIQAASFPRVTLESRLRRTPTEHAHGSQYARRTIKWKDDDYHCQEYGGESPIVHAHKEIFRDYADVEMIAAEDALGNLFLDNEAKTAALLTNDNNVGIVSNASVSWHEPDNSDIKLDIINVFKTMFLDTETGKGFGIVPNKIIVSHTTFLSMTLEKKFRESLSNTNDTQEIGTFEQKRQLLSNYLGLDILVAGSLENTANEGLDLDLKQVWPEDKAIILKASMGGNDLSREISAGRTILWEDDSFVMWDGMSPIGTVYETYEEPQTRQTIVRARQQVDRKIFQKEAIAILNLNV